MKQVSKKYFYSKIGKLDVAVHVKGNFPYITEFRIRHGEIIAKVIDYLPRPITTKYYTNL